MNKNENKWKTWRKRTRKQNETSITISNCFQIVKSFKWLQGGVGYVSNKHGFSVESSVQGISSNSLFVETKQFVSRNVNVILRQTCGQRSSMSTGSKRRAPGNCFPMCIWYVKGCCIVKLWQIVQSNTFLNQKSHPAGAFFLQIQNSCIDLDHRIWYPSSAVVLAHPDCALSPHC